MAATLMNGVPMAMFQRKRNNSGGSTGSSVSSMDTDISAPLTPTSPFLQLTDIQTIANLLSVQPNLQAEQVKSLASRYKTELCRSFEETGFCKYGEKCQFAHGTNEMKCLPRHPKYKSELCRTFHTSGFCPYGMRCHFIHSEDESKLTEISLMKHQAAAMQATQQMLQQAARLKLQQQALEQQMQALAMSQINMQVAQKQVSSVSRPILYSQMSMVNNKMPVNTPKPVIERTSFPVFNTVLDTPPITPPCGSPTFDIASRGTSKVISPPPGFEPKHHSRLFTETTPYRCLSLNFGETQNNNMDNMANQLNDIVSRIGQIQLESGATDLYTPSTSPDSGISSPLDSPKSSRLPVFSRIVS